MEKNALHQRPIQSDQTDQTGNMLKQEELLPSARRQTKEKKQNVNRI